MKNTFFTALILLVSSQISYAQDARFGIIAGANASNWRGDFQDSEVVSGGLIAYNFGVFAAFGLNDSFSFSPRIQYSVQGYKSESFVRQINGEVLNVLEVAFRHGYVNVPLLFKLKVANGLKVHAGPQVGLFVDGTSKIVSATQGDSVGAKADFDLENKWDYGANLGLSYHFNDKIFVEALYYHGLANITDNPDFGFDNKQYFFQLNLAYAIF